MKYLTINAGSSSLKVQCIEMPSERVLYRVEFRNYAKNSYEYISEVRGREERRELTEKDYTYSIDYLLDDLVEFEIIESINDIDVIIHRIVHGGEYFRKPEELTSDVIEKITELSAFAPLHNPPALEKVQYFADNCKGIKQFGVFDTSIHLDNPKENFLYGLPYGYYENLGVRRFGFHGISYEYILNRVEAASRMIICHLGSGSSVAAIKDNKSINNSFGFSPNENLIMSTRSGEVDFDAMVFLKQKLGLSDAEIDTVLNKESGLLGISGISGDMKELLELYKENDRAALAVDKYVLEVVKYISQFFVELGGIDTLVFTGGIGANSAPIRKMISDKLSPLSISIDEVKNEALGAVEDLEEIGSGKIRVLAVRTNEELQMARDIFNANSSKTK